jgi:hypothetical protein
MGTIAGIAAIAAFIAAAVMLLLSGFGLFHARRTAADTEILPGHPGRGQHSPTTPAGTTRNGSQPPADDLIGTVPVTPAPGTP